MRIASRIPMILGIIAAAVVIIFAGVHARGIAATVCTSPSVHAILETSVFGDICPVPVPDPTLPQGTASDTFGTPAAESAPRGISCPASGTPGTPVAISWSCGASATLVAAAGFTPADHEQTSAMIVPTAASSTYGIRCSDGFESMCSIATNSSSVKIVAEPQRVQLGSRTNIFWDSADAASCEVTGPSFEETGLRGGASTVPIAIPSTFIARCTTLAGGSVQAQVTVDIAQ